MSEEKSTFLSTIPLSDTTIAKMNQWEEKLSIQILPVSESSQIPDEIWQNTKILYTDKVFPDPELAAKLSWIQLDTIQFDNLSLSNLIDKPGLKITHMSGANALQTAEAVVSAMLAAAHGYPVLLKDRYTKKENPDFWKQWTPKELRGSTVGIIGYGSVGREIARLIKPFNPVIYAVKNDVMHPQEDDYSIKDTGDPGGHLFNRLYPVQALESVVSESDFIVVSLSKTEITERIFTQRVIKAVKKNAILVVISDPVVLDIDEITKSAKTGTFHSIIIDSIPDREAFEEHPILNLDNVIFTPGIFSKSEFNRERKEILLLENLERFLSGNVLLNVFDKEKGY